MAMHKLVIYVDPGPMKCGHSHLELMETRDAKAICFACHEDKLKKDADKKPKKRKVK